MGWKPQRQALVSLIMPWLECGQRVGQFEQTREFLRAGKRWRKFPTSYQGFVKAQRRDGEELRRRVERRAQAVLPQLAGEHWRWKSFVPLAVDGSRLEAPRTADNERVLGCAGREKTTPQVMLTVLYHLGTSLPYASRVGPGVASERALLDEMLDDLPQNTLLLADSGFIGAELIETLSQRNHAFLLRVGGNRELLRDVLPETTFADQQVWCWPRCRQRDRPPHSLRLIEIEADNADQPNVFLLTNLGADQMTDEEAGALYRQRWGVEVFFRTAKQTLESRKLKSRAADLSLLEAAWLPASVFLLGALQIASRTASRRKSRDDSHDDSHDDSRADSRDDSRAGSRADSRDDSRAVKTPARRGELAPRSDWSAARTRRVICDRIRNHHRRGARWSRSLTRDLSACRHDSYQRRRPKSTRRHPQKKQQRPPHPPKQRPATLAEQQQATRLAQQKPLS